MSYLHGQNFWEEDNGRTVVIQNPTKPFYIRLACQPNTGYSWTFANSSTVPLNSSSGNVTANAAKVISNARIETDEFSIRRRYYGKGKFTGENENGAVLGGGGGYVFIVTPPLADMMQAKHKMAGKKITLTFHYARPWARSASDKDFSITLEAAA